MATRGVILRTHRLAHEEQERRFYELERRIETLERRIDQLEMKPQQAAPRQAEKPPPAEHQELFDCQAEAIDSTEMKACAKYIPRDEALSDKYLTE